MKRQKVLLLSGGLDSTILFYDLLYSNVDFRCAWIDYGQRNARAEQQAVIDICQPALIPIQCIFVPCIFEGMRSTLLKGGEHTVQSDEILNRNAVLINIAASHCDRKSEILVAAHRTNAPYRDATAAFYTLTSAALRYSTNNLVSVSAPYIHYTKEQIVARAEQLELPRGIINSSVSCYEGNNCGKCPACISRKNALKGTKYE